MIVFFSNTDEKIFISSVSRYSEASIINSTRSAPDAASRAFLVPMLSIGSSVFLIPAVSISLSNISSNLTYSSIVSLVVPGISETIALSCPVKRFKSDDLPEFGRPAIHVLMPSLTYLPLL